MHHVGPMKRVGDRLLAVVLALLLQSCASLSSLQSAKTTPKGKVTNSISMEYAPNLSSGHTLSPSVGMRFGMTHWLDLGTRFWPIGAQADAVVRVISIPAFWVATGLGVQGQTIGTPNASRTGEIKQVFLPLYFTAQMGDLGEFTLSPKLSYHNTNTDNSSTLWVSGMVEFTNLISKGKNLLIGVDCAGAMPYSTHMCTGTLGIRL